VAEPKHRIGMVSVWLGDFPSEEEVHAYALEIVEVDGCFTTQFSKDAGIQVHPHFCEYTFSQQATGVSDHVEDVSFGDTFRDELLQRCEELGIESVKSGVFAFELDYPADREFPNSSLKFVGSFPFSHDFPE
jgi:hypothetical protein